MPTFVGSPGDDILTGGPDADIIDGLGGDDQLSGGPGNDSLAGGSGADTLSGGDGDDFLYAGNRNLSGDYGYYNYLTPPVLDTGTEVDTLVGGSGSDHLFAGYGDNVDGGTDGAYGDYLIVSFIGAPTGVVVDFHLPTQIIGGGTITGIENVSWVQGSNFDDDINVGSSTSNGYSDFTTVLGMGGNDHLVAGYYTGWLDGGDGDDIVDGRNSQYLHAVIGGAGNDTLYTNTNTFASADGGDGDDRIFAHGEIHGGNGNDYIEIQYSYYPGPVTGDAGDDEIHAAAQVAATIAGGTGADLIVGSNYNDVISTGDAPQLSYYALTYGDDLGLEHDVVQAGAGDDLVSGGYGDDLDGGTGNDQLRYSFAGLRSGIDFNTAILVGGQPASVGGGTVQNFETLTYLRGTDFNDVIRLATQDSLLEVNAGAGDDVVYTGNSSAKVFGGAGNDTFVSGIAGDIFDGGDGSDTVDYSGTVIPISVTLFTGTGGSGPGGDQLVSIENLIGTAYDDTLIGAEVANSLHGGAGNDLLDGGAGNDSLFGEAGDDQLRGGDGNDLIDGGDGNDQIDGGTGADTITAGLGDDVITVSGTQTGVGLSINGGADSDKLILALSGGGQFSGAGVSGVEQLQVQTGGTLTSLSGFTSISTVNATLATTFQSSLNPLADLAIGTALVRLQSSTVASVTGSAGNNLLTLSDSTQVSGAINLAGGNDTLTLTRATGSLPTIGGQVDGGAGTDTLALSWSQTNATYAVDLANYRDFENLNVNTANAAGSTVLVSNATGWSQLVAGANTALTVSGSLSPDLNVSVASGSLTIDSDVVLRRVGLPDSNGVPQPTDLSATDATLSLTVANDGAISSNLVFNIGNDVYNGQNGTVGGTVFGNGGNDQLFGGSGIDRFDGGYGKDILSGGLGADILRGGAGADIFLDTVAGHAGDTISDLSYGDTLVFSDAALGTFTYSLSGTTLTYTGGSLTLSSLPSTTFVMSAAAGGGVQLKLLPPVTAVPQIFQVSGSPVVANFNLANGWSSQNLYPRHVADLNGDGNADIVGFGYAGVLVAAGSASGGFGGTVLVSSDFGQTSGWTNDNLFHRAIGDLNGDGKSDILGFGYAGTLVAASTGSGFAAATLGTANFGKDQGWTSQDGFARLVGDVDGDGKADIVGFGYAGALVALGNGDGTFGQVRTGVANFGVDQGWKSDFLFHRELADVNGDGKADIIGFGYAGTFVALSRGDGTFADPRLGLANFGADQGWANNDNYARVVADVNGDGKADIVGFGISGTLIAFGKGDGTFEPARFDVLDFARAQGWTSDNITHREMFDLNHDGFIDVVGFGTAGVLVGLNNLGFVA